MTTPHHFFNRDGDPIGVDGYANLFRDPEYKIVKQEAVEGLFVSTVWLGINHRFGAGSPLIFETMIFDHRSPSLWNEEYCERHSTEEEALAGHAVAVEYAKNELLTKQEKGTK